MKIILVDDEPLFHKIFAMKYRSRIAAGEFSLESYEHGKACLDAIHAMGDQQRQEIIVIFSDINMPVMNGLEMLKELKQNYKDLPVVMVSAYSNEDTKDFISILGGIELIPKPVEFERISEIIEMLLAERKKGVATA